MKHSGHTGKHFVIQKGKAICNKGTHFPNFKVTSHQKHYWNHSDEKVDYLAVTEDDVQFTLINTPFGNCSMKNGQPCSFSPVGKWIKAYEKVKVMGKSCITEASELQCSIGGMIKVLKHGQTVEIGRQNLKNVNPLKISIMNPLINIKEILNEIEEEDYIYDFE